MAKLVLLMEDGTTRDVVLQQERVTLGRRADNDICLPHPAVSGEHAQITTLLADSFLEDLGSTNGTLVNGRMVQKHFLHDGDVIELGRQRLVYLADDNARPHILPPASTVRASAPAPDFNHVGTPSGPTVWDWQSRAGGLHVGSARGGDTELQERVHDNAAQAAAEQAAARHDPQHHTTQAPELMVLTGPSAGRSLALTKEITTVGRTGVQVALVRRTSRGYVVTAGEGSRPPLINGVAGEPGGTLLAPGDIMEVAGARIEFMIAPDLPT